MTEFRGNIYGTKSVHGQQEKTLWSYNDSYYGLRWSPINLTSSCEFEGYGCYSCRDLLLGHMRTLITTGIPWATESRLNTDKLRLLCIYSSATKSKKDRENMFAAGKNVLNIFEKELGWPLTTMHDAKLKDQEIFGGPNVFTMKYFLGSRRWVKAPPMTSLFCLLVRICRDERWAEVKSYKDIRSLISAVKNGKQKPFKYESGWIRDTSDNWFPMLKSYPDLFRKRKIESYWGSLDGYSGIDQIFKTHWIKHPDVKKAFIKKGWKSKEAASRLESHSH